MISRNKAMEVLRQLEYIRYDVSPNRSAYDAGIYMPVYFAVGPTKWYPYGDGNSVDGYISPIHDTEYPDLIGRRIGYSGEVELF